MATSFVEFNGHGFWCPDSLLEVFAWLVASELSSTESMAEYAAHLRSQATAGLGGCIDFGLDSLSDASKALLIRASERAIEHLERDPGALSAQSLTLAKLGGGVTFEFAVDPQPLDAVARMFSSLLTGTWTWGVGDEPTLPSAWLRGRGLR